MIRSTSYWPTCPFAIMMRSTAKRKFWLTYNKSLMDRWPSFGISSMPTFRIYEVHFTTRSTKAAYRTLLVHLGSATHANLLTASFYPRRGVERSGSSSGS